MQLDSVYIETPEEYEQFRAGTIGNNMDRFTISLKRGARFDIFADIKHFAASDYHTVLVWNFYLAYISVSPAERSCYTLFGRDRDQFRYLPVDYDTYYITGDRYDVSAADIDVLLTWRTAKSISIVGQSDCAYAIARRIDRLKLMRLKRLQLPLHPASAAKLNATLFLESMDHLTDLTFIVTANMDTLEFWDFARRQATFAGFTKDYSHRHLTFRRHFEEVVNTTAEAVQSIEYYGRTTFAMYDIRHMYSEQSVISYATHAMRKTIGCTAQDVSDTEIFGYPEFASNPEKYCQEAKVAGANEALDAGFDFDRVADKVRELALA